MARKVELEAECGIERALRKRIVQGGRDSSSPSSLSQHHIALNARVNTIIRFLLSSVDTHLLIDLFRS